MDRSGESESLAAYDVPGAAPGVRRADDRVPSRTAIMKRDYDKQINKEINPKERNGHINWVLVLHGRKGGAGGSLGKFGSFSQALLRHVVGQVLRCGRGRRANTSAGSRA